jgi:predicted nucleic-acid-binding Zn-ribbon protein
MEMKQRCPKCGSDNIQIYDGDLPFIKCLKCKYDELDVEPIPSDPRTNQKSKGNFSPYKTGGSKRTRP